MILSPASTGAVCGCRADGCHGFEPGGGVVACREFATAAEGLAAEAAMVAQLRAAGQGHAALCWQSHEDALVLPGSLARQPWFGLLARRAAEAGLPLVLRQSGGGLVPQGRGFLNFALATHVAPGTPLESGYRLLLRPVIAALQGIGVETQVAALAGAFCDGRFNLLVRGRKLAGTAQRWSAGGRTGGGHIALGHAVIVIGADVARRVAGMNAICAAVPPPGPGRYAIDAHTSLTQELAMRGRVAPSPEGLSRLILGALDACPPTTNAVPPDFHHPEEEVR